MTDIVLSRIFGAPFIQQTPNRVFERHGITPLAHVVEHVTDEMPVIEPVQYATGYGFGQRLDPRRIVGS